MMGIFRFLLAAAAAELMASLSLPQWPSGVNSSGLGGRSAVDKMEILCDGVACVCPAAAVAAAEAAALASKVDPLEILRVAVGEGWSDDVVGSRRADEAGDTEPEEPPLTRSCSPARGAGRDGSCSCTVVVGASLLGVGGERVAGVAGGRVVRKVVVVVVVAVVVCACLLARTSASKIDPKQENAKGRNNKRQMERWELRCRGQKLTTFKKQGAEPIPQTDKGRL